MFNNGQPYTYGDYDYVSSVEVTAKSTVAGSYRYDYNNVEFIIVSGAGDNIKVDHYVGNEALINAYKDKYDDGVGTVNLTNVAVVTTAGDGINGSYVTTIFAYEKATLAGGIAFFPEDVTGWNVHDNTFYNVMAYLNGSKVGEEIDVVYGAGNVIKAGFYSYTINDKTEQYTLTAVKPGISGIVLGNNAVRHFGTLYTLVDGGTEYTLPSDTPVIDLRSEDNRDSVIDDVSDLVDTNYTSKYAYNLAYVVGNDTEVDYIYVVDANEYSVTTYVDYINAHGGDGDTALTGDGMYKVVSPVIQTVDIWAGSDKTVDIVITRGPEGNADFSKESYNVTYWDTASESEKTVTGSVIETDVYGDVITFEVEVTGNTTINVMSVK